MLFTSGSPVVKIGSVRFEADLIVMGKPGCTRVNAERGDESEIAAGGG
jgi:hypothetical protein